MVVYHPLLFLELFEQTPLHLKGVLIESAGAWFCPGYRVLLDDSTPPLESLVRIRHCVCQSLDCLAAVTTHSLQYLLHPRTRANWLIIAATTEGSPQPHLRMLQSRHHLHAYLQ